MKKATLLFSLVFFAQLMFSQAPCIEPSGFNILNVNNVKAHVGPVGSMFFNDQGGSIPGYEIPQGNGTHSIFAMGTWIGATSPSGGLKLSASTYRQSGVDFWPGPVSTDGSLLVDEQTCTEYDRVWNVYRWQVNLHRLYFDRVEFDLANGTTTAQDSPFDNGYAIPMDILEWPGNGDVSLNQAEDLAPYIDRNMDGHFDATDGDYPAFYYPEFGSADKDFHLFGDQALWWIYNDVGNIHTEFEGEPLGVEFHCTAYAFNTFGDLNNATFYRQEFINRSSETWLNTWIGTWADTDLGCYNDDYVGCDVMKNMGYSYNGDLEDENCSGANGYGLLPPAIGVDYLEGPLADNSDGIDNDKDLTIDENGEHCSMNKFVHFSNTNNPMNGNPEVSIEAYNLLHGKWLNGQSITYGGSGTDSLGIPACFMFPGTSDPFHFGTNGVDPGFLWDESLVGNFPTDKRFIQSSGPFTVEPGEVNYLHFAIPWAKSTDSDDPVSVQALCDADSVIQVAFDDCFQDLLSVGIQDLWSESEECVQIFPNPNTGTFIFDLNDFNSQVYLLEVFDTSFRLIYKKSLTQQRSEINLEVRPGIYVARVLSKNEILCTKKIIVQ